MRFAIATLITAAAAALAAPPGRGWDKPYEAAAGEGAIHIITVSDGGFWPASLEAKAGDFLEFRFVPGTHSVVQSSFSNPCGFLNGGFASGEMSTSEDKEENRYAFRVPVSGDGPIWLYNGSVDQCHEDGLKSTERVETMSRGDFVKIRLLTLIQFAQMLGGCCRDYHFVNACFHKYYQEACSKRLVEALSAFGTTADIAVHRNALPDSLR
ncbi:hypothetical protein CFO_g3813 [Ceratocystis platani]|uniref:Extracellular serine-rich protein n=1 Tax=Ceratocystis fimbriata f. sp. platani TaxID=88771 RepID=A0A0F8DCS8_CERFI|nr:hypothetical protein CFO_g3813 [Ceratocystis platani]